MARAMNRQQSLLQHVFHAIAGRRHSPCEKNTQHFRSFAQETFVGRLVAPLCPFEELGESLIASRIQVSLAPDAVAAVEVRRNLMRSISECGYMK